MARLILTALLILTTNLLLAQFLVTGTVKDQEGDLPYANIAVKGTTIGTTTDLDGKFELKVPGESCTLVVSYIGYDEIEIEVTVVDKEITVVMEAVETITVTTTGCFPITIYTLGTQDQVYLGRLDQNSELSIAPAINQVPGIHMHSGALNTNRIVIRGIGSRSPYATSKLRAYLDNIPLSSGDGETTLEDIDLSIIQNMTISKGPTKSSAGANLGGRIFMNTHNQYGNRPRFQFKNSSTVGSYGLLRNTTSFQHNNLEKELQLTANVNVTHNKGYRENSQYDRQGATLLARKRWNENETTFLTNFVNLKAFIPSSLNKDDYENEPRKAAFTWGAVKGNEAYQKILVGLANTVVFADGGTWRATNSSSVFSSYRNNYETRPFNILDENSLSLGLRTSFDLEDSYSKFKLSLGGEIFNEAYAWKTLEQENGQAAGLLSDNAEDRSFFNTFLQAKYEPFYRFSLEAGLNVNHTRYNYQDLISISGTDQSAKRNFSWIPSPSIDIRYEIMNTVNLQASARHGFSAPSLEETLRPDGGINPDIAVEKGWNFELGASGKMRNWFYQLSAYTMQVKDLLVAQRIGPDQYIGVNAGKTQHNGLELSTRYNLRKNNYTLEPRINYTLSDFTFKEFIDDGEDYSGNPLTGVAPHQLNIGLDFEHDIGLYGKAAYSFHSAYSLRDDNSIDSESYHLTNLKIGFLRKINDHIILDFYLGINNLFNEKYASMHVINANGFGGAAPRYYYPGLPRNFYGNFTFTYEW